LKEAIMTSKSPRCARTLATLGTVVALFLAACQAPAATSIPSPSAGSPSAQGQFVDTGTLTFAIPGEPPTLDPAIEVGGPGYRYLVQTYDGLLEYKGDTAELAPALAQSWTVAPDGSSITLKLRPNVKFHDGSALDAETVKASIDRTVTMNRGGAFFLGALKQVDVVDPMTVKLVAKYASVSLLYGLPKVYITGKAHLSDPDHGAAYLAANDNGTGPYMLERWDKGQQIVLDRYPGYWKGWDGPHVSKVIERVVPDAGTQQLLLERGEAQMVILASIGITQDPKEEAAKPGIKMVTSKSYRVTVISMNTQKGPLKDVRVRQAVELAFDYAGMRQIYKGYADPANDPLPKDFSAAYDSSLVPFTQKLDAAKKLLADAGYPSGGFSLKFVYTSTEPQAQLAALMIQQGLATLGVTVNIVSEPFATQVAEMVKLDTAPDMQATLTMTPRTADPGELLSTLYSSANAGLSYNYAWYKSKEVDDLLLQADQTFDDTKRMALYRQVTTKLMQDAPSIWAAFPQLVEVMRVEVQGYVYNPLQYSGVFSIYPIWLKK
jgi:peptide/nickel transport system substrate-binding protein